MLLFTFVESLLLPQTQLLYTVLSSVSIVPAITFYVPAFAADLCIVLFWFACGKRVIWKVSQKWFGPNRGYNGLVIGALAGGLAGLVVSTFWLGLLLGVGAWMGSMANSFVKRRLRIKPGGRFLPLDQLDFILGATLAASIISFNLLAFLLAVVGAPFLHRLGNIVLFRMGIKDVPY